MIRVFFVYWEQRYFFLYYATLTMAKTLKKVVAVVFLLHVIATLFTLFAFLQCINRSKTEK